MPRKTVPDPIPEGLLSRTRTAARLGVTESTVDRMTRAGRLPCIRVGGRVMYDPGALGVLIASGRSSERSEREG